MQYESLKKDFPLLAEEWHPTLNGDLTPENVKPFSSRRVWWLCPVCHNEWDAEISARSSGNGCPYCSGRRVKEGFSDLRTKYPAVAEEWHPYKNGELTPEKITSKSSRKVWWKCSKCGHEWKADIASRTAGNGCPACYRRRFSKEAANRALKPGINDLRSNYPDVAAELHPEKNNGLTASEITAHSNRKVWWKCGICGNEWIATVNDRTSGHGCPKCGNKSKSEKLTKKNLVPGVTDLKTRYPVIAAEWDVDKNASSPSDYTPFSVRKVWWKCEKGHSYRMPIASRTGQGQGCPYCGSRKVLEGFNDLGTLFPDIAAEWDYGKNTKKPNELLPKSEYRAYWLCPKGHSFRTRVAERTTNKKTEYCPICSGKQVLPGFNDLSTVRPELAAQWDPVKNGEVKPTDVVEYSNKKVWWLCEKGHSWKAAISGRSRGNGCPYCSNTWLLKGFNDVETLFPDVAKEWAPENEKGPDEYIAGSHFRVKWVCSTCGHHWSTVVKDRTYGGRNCPKCTHYFHTSVPEQAVFYYVKQMFPDAVNSFNEEKSGGWEIDVYIPSLSMGIEYDGGFWHSDPGKDKRKTTTLHEKGIELIRIRENKTEPLDDGSIQILTDTSFSDLNKLKPALDVLFDILLQKTPTGQKPDIDLDRDYTKILAMSEGNKYEKSLAATESPILQEWDYEKNNLLTPEKVTAHSKKKAWWVCSNCGNSWRQAIDNKYKGGLYCEACSRKKAREESNIAG